MHIKFWSATIYKILFRFTEIQKPAYLERSYLEKKHIQYREYKRHDILLQV